jgi:hypothetical protein
MCLIMVSGAISCADGFPLTSGNGIVSATVYGVTAENGAINTYFRIDMSATHSTQDPNDDYLVELVDSEDRVHETFEAGDHNFGGNGPRYNGSVRRTLVFAVPKDTVIKRLKITPDASDPFSIDWNGVPKTSANDITMSFYNGQRIPPQRDLDEYEYQWILDIKVTNNDNTTLSFSTKDFALKDQNGWVYAAEEVYARGIKLLPNESLRFPITFNDVGEFARPSAIMFHNVTMDIGAWV